MAVARSGMVKLESFRSRNAMPWLRTRKWKREERKKVALKTFLRFNHGLSRANDWYLTRVQQTRFWPYQKRGGVGNRIFTVFIGKIVNIPFIGNKRLI